MPRQEPSTVKAIIFDMDGTLIDSVDQHAKSWRDALLLFGHQVSFEEVRAQIGKGGDELMPVFLSPEEIERFGDRLQAARAGLLKERYFEEIEPFPQVRALFEKLLSDGYKIVLASSAKSEELKTYKQIAAIDDLLDDETSSEDTERSKPHPDIFVAALRKLGGVEPHEVIAVGDTPYDAEAAGKAGIATIGLRCGGWSDADLGAAGCIAIFDDAATLLHEYDQSPFSRLPG